MKLRFGIDPQEVKKRKREIFSVLFICLLILFLSWFEVRLFSISQELPMIYSIFFLGLVNLNVVLLLILFFLIFRNIAKVYAERQGRVIGSSLKLKLIGAFGAFSFVPAIFIFSISIYYVDGSFDKWFSTKMSGVLRDSLEVRHSFYTSAKRRNYHFARKITEELNPRISVDDKGIRNVIERLREHYGLHALEYYPGVEGERLISLSKDEAVPEIPRMARSFLERGIVRKAEISHIEKFSQGNLVRVVVPVSKQWDRGAIVVSTFFPISLISKMDKIAQVYEDINPLKYPIKSVFYSLLFLVTLVILLAATWFGIYLARQLSGPLELVGVATHQVAKGEYQAIEVTSGSAEINQLVANFNAMIVDIAQSRGELQHALVKLDERSRYIEVVLSNVTTGVVAVDQQDRITTINRYAAQLLQIEVKDFVGREIGELLPETYRGIFDEIVRGIKSFGAVSLKKEITLEIHGRSVPLQVTVSFLLDENGKEIGKILVFDDLTHVVNAQRAAAWTEVARRIAHEIKNPLTPIKLSAQRLQKKFAHQIQDQAFVQCTGMIIEQADELRTLVNEFSNFARLPEVQPVMGSINSIVESTLTLYRTAHREVDFSFIPDPTVPNFRFDPGQMKRVLVNLLDNAVGALTPKRSGKVEIVTDYDSLLKITRLTVKDNGEGISDSLKDRIFEPYFSTKEGGTGLGLAIVKRIVEDHNGFVRVFSTEGVETRIVVELPVLGSGLERAIIEPGRDNEISG